jgi:hypothetical protein
MKKLFLPILAFLMLTAPYAHGMAGYAFHFDAVKPSWSFKELLQPDKFYTQHIQPKDRRPNPEYADEIFKMKEIMGIKTPIIVKNEKITANPRALASATNYPFYSRLRLNQEAFVRETERNRSYDNTQTIAHELTHIKNKDHRTQLSLASLQDTLDTFGNAALCGAGLSLFSRTKRHLAPLSLIAGFTTKFATQEAVKKIDDILDDLEPQSDEEALTQVRKQELLADEGSVITMAECGYCKALEKWQGDNTWMMEKLYNEGKPVEKIREFRPSGQTNPTLLERYLFTEKALSKCRKDVDPSSTKDTPNLMRNGS